MKFAIQAFVLLFASTSVCFAQETQPDEKKKSPTGFEWLKQFEGNWTTVSKSTGSESGTVQKATLESRTVGNRWIVNDHRGDLGAGMKFHAVQTIGYDAATKKFKGTWVDSVLDHTWNYTGSLDESGQKLNLEAEGPDWNDMTKTKRYRDVYEFTSPNVIAGTSQMMNDKGEWETFITSTITRENEPDPSPITPFLMFEGQAVAAIDYYKTVFADTEILEMTKYKAGEPGTEGTIKVATISIAGQRVMCIDSPAKHEFTFTPSFSFFVECETEEQLKERFAKLSDGGKVMMPVGAYGFSRQFGWTSDKFGVSWQLNVK